MKVLALLVPLLVTIQAESSNDPQILTESGLVLGTWDYSISGRKYASFEGIPYAEPPTGKLRFERPVKKGKWNGTWEATNQISCIQYYHYTEPGDDFVKGDEDCLYVNVYSANTEAEKLLPVIIFIHGGAFMFNSGTTYGPKILMNRDLVYVTFNYRLGPLGFLSTEDEIVPGNNGIRDQILALEWIQTNIECFGGDPDSITLTGMSAGGASVQLHFMSPLSEGLFNRGIAQSGCMLNPWVLVEKSLEKAKKLSESLGCTTNNNEDMVKCLKDRPAKDIVNSVKLFLPWLYNPFSPFGIVVDKWVEDPVLPEHPLLLLKAKKIKELPIIYSNVESEGLYPGADFLSEPPAQERGDPEEIEVNGNVNSGDTKEKRKTYLPEIEERWLELAPYILDYNNTAPEMKKHIITNKVKLEYFKDELISLETYPKLIKMMSDRLFIADIGKCVKLHVKAVKSPVYHYYFAYRGAHSKMEYRAKSNENYGASHGDDTVYVLSSNVDTQSTEQDRIMSEIFVNVWESYAKFGIPRIGEWRPVRNNGDTFNGLKISSPENIQMEEFQEFGNRAFWMSLGLEENENLFNVKDEL